MHGYKWPINCTRTRTMAMSVGALPDLLARNVQHNDGNSLTDGERLNFAAEFLLANGEEGEEWWRRQASGGAQ